MVNRLTNFMQYALTYCCFFICNSCPYKNQKEALLKEDSFQTIQFQRNHVEEQKGGAFGFHFWLFFESHENKYLINRNQFNPFHSDKETDGYLILTVEEQELKRFLIMSSLANNFYAIAFENDIDTSMAIGDGFLFSWQFFLIVIKPADNELIVQVSESLNFLMTNFKMASQIININLGGFKLIQSKYNLNNFKGKLTKLEILNYFFYNSNTYRDFLYYCIVPQKFIQSLGVYLLNETSCQIGCLVCRNNDTNYCLVFDEEFQNYLSYNGEIYDCLSETRQISFYLQKFFFICVDFQVLKPYISLIEVPKTIEFNCLFGYFHAQYNNDNFCIKCPQKTSEIIECVECLIQNNLRYMQPICKSDFVQVNDLPGSSYKLQERSAENYEYFIIDETLSLIYLIGVSQICLEEGRLQDCFLLKQKHFNQTIYVKCLQNFFIENGGCYQEDNNCQNLISKGNCNQCKKGSYLYKGSCQYCENNCKTCIYSDQFDSSICITCIEYFTIVQNKCWQCGLFCLACIEDYDEFSNNYFARCLMCIDDSKYFLSFDGINCLENTIKNCQYAFQSVKGNIELSTLDYQFQRQQNLSQIETLCGRCFDFYAFVFPLKQCIKYQQEQCLFGYTVSVYDSDELQDNQFDQLFDENKLIKVSKIECLIQKNQGECFQVANCLKCLFIDSLKQYICIQCKQGFYINRISFKCYNCMINNCISCYHQSKLSKDFWKLQTLPFYLNFIQIPHSHSFFEFAQSQDIFDYEIVCDSCSQAANLFNNLCYKNQELCFKHELINNDYICADCGTLKNIQLTLEKNQCTSCPHNCYACKRPEHDQQYNPYFQIENSFPLLSSLEFRPIEPFGYDLNWCFKPYNMDHLFYDSEVHQFVNCKNFLDGCEKHLIIQRELTCLLDLSEYYQSILEDYFEYIDILTFSVDQTVKKIILKLESIKPMRCKLPIQFLLELNFANDISSLKEMELEINCFHEVIWEMQYNIIFRKFQKVTFNGLFIKIIENSSLKKFEFISLKNQQITFNNVTFQHQSRKIDYFQFCFVNATNINFFNTIFEDLNIHNDIPLFSIQNAKGNTTIQFSNVSFENLNLYNSSLIQVQGEESVKLIFKNILFFKGKMQNSTLISRNSKKIVGETILLNFTLQNIILKECSSFLYLSTFQQIFIDKFLIQTSSIIKSNLVSLSQLNFIYNFDIISSTIQLESILLQNVDMDQQSQSYYFQNNSFQYNKYSKLSKFIFIQQYNSENSEILLQNFTLRNNLIEINNTIDLMNINSSLILLELSNITICDIYIERSSTINEFVFKQIKNLTIQNSIITQRNEDKVLGIHQYFECFDTINKNNLYGISFYIYSAEFVIIKNLTVKQTQRLNYPILFFNSESQIINKQQEILIFSQITFEQNLQIQTLNQTKSGLILIQSDQELKIIIENSNFNSNILQVYSNETLVNSAAILNVNAKYSELFINFSCFEKNIVFNSEAGMLYIESSEVQIQNCTFYSNNIFIYEVIQPYLIWTYNYSQVIYLEQIKKLLKIQSLYGLGYFLIKKISVGNSFFEICQGLKAYFYISILGNGKAQFQFLRFSSNDSNLNLDNQLGPIIYIDGVLSQSLEMQIQNIKAGQIFSNQKGGILYAIVAEGNVTIVLKNINLTNVFADEGTLIYFENIKSITDQNTIKLSNIIYIWNQNEQDYFLNKWNSQDFDNKKSKEYLGQKNSLIYISKANSVKISELRLEGLFFQSALVIKDANNIQLVSISILEGFFNERAILVIPNFGKFIQYLASKAKIIIENFKAINMRFGQLKIQNYEQNIIPQKIQFFGCENAQNKAAPIFLSKFSSQNQQKIKINFSIINAPLFLANEYGLVHLAQLNQFHQIKINDLELQNITCSLCSMGLISINFNITQQDLRKQEITNIIMSNSQCGYKGCINIFTSSSKKLIPTYNVLQSLEFFVQNYVCQLNQAISGTCLFLENVRLILSKSTFTFNNASSAGGALYLKQSSMNNQLVIEKTVIQNNIAFIGGGIFMDGQQELNFEKLDTIVSENKAQYFANDVSAIPSKLFLQIGSIQDDLFEIKTLKSNDTYKLQIQKLLVATPQHGFKTNFTLLPNGISICQYRYFDWRNRVYIGLNFSLKIIALTGLGMEMKNLKDSYCQIKSRIIQLSDQKEVQILSGNFTSFTSVNFNDETQNYNLDNITIYKREDLNDEEVLELEFWCSSVFVPVYNKNYPYNLLSQHNQYFLRLQIKTYPCQLGEIRNETSQNCLTCKSLEGFFQLKLNQTQCLRRDQVSTIEVQPAMLNLKVGFWRPYFDTSEVSECYNSHKNCKGGWIEGDTSCKNGNLGALCEQCDLYNIRGEGQFFLNKQYTCMECSQLKSQYFYFALRILWIFISLSISVSGNFQSVNEKVQALRLQKIGFKIHFKQNSKTLLFKILINYLHIINSITSFQIDLYFLPQYTSLIKNQTTLPNQMECLFTQILDIEIQYLRAIWSLIMPFVYFSFCFLFYAVISFYKKIQVKLSFITTTLIYLYFHFSPILVGEFILLVSYRFISGYYWISSNVSYRYDTQKHLSWMMYLAVPSLITIILIIPVYLLQKLFKSRLQLDKKDTRELLGFLYNEFKNELYYWEILKILQKIILIFILTFYYEKIYFKGGMLILILIFYQTLSLKYQPYLTKQYNKLDYFSSQVCLYSISLSLGIFESQKKDQMHLILLFQLIQIVINLNFLLKLVFQIFYQYLMGNQKSHFQSFYSCCEIILRLAPFLRSINFLQKIDAIQQLKKARIQNLFFKLKEFLKKQSQNRINTNSMKNSC